MAEDLGTVYWKVKADTSELDRAEASMDALGNKAKSAGKDAGKLGDDVSKAGKKSASAAKEMESGFGGAAKAIKTVGAALAAWGVTRVVADTIKTTADFSKAISNLSAITGATGKDLQFYSDQAKEIGRTTSLSASQAVEGFKLIASAKPDLLASAESLAAVTREAVTLAEAAGIGLPDAAKAIGAALNQFQMPAEKANEVINILAASAQQGTAEIVSVTEAMRNAGSAANSLGLDFTETVSGIQALAAAGREGADAGTALRQVLLKLEATGDEQLQPSIVGLVGALDQLKTMNLDNTQLMDLFGQEAFTAATSLLAQSDVAKQLNETMRGTNVATEQAATNMDNLSGDYLKANSAIETLQITIGERAEPAMRKMAQATASAAVALTDFLTGMSNEDLIESLGLAVDENGKLVDSAEAAAAAAAKYQAGMSSAATAANEFTDATYEAWVAAQDAKDGIDGTAAAAVQYTDDTLKLIDALQNEKKALGMTTREQAMFAAELKAIANKDGPDAIKTVRRLAAENYDLAESQEKAKDELEAFNASIAEYLKEQKRSREETEKNTQSINETIQALENEKIALDMTARSAAVFQAVTQATASGALPAQIAQIATLTAELYDMEAAQDATGESAKTAARVAEEAWGRTHDYMSGAFVDLMNNGGNAFDNIAKSFEQMVKRMVAEWAASKLMSVFGMSAPGGGGGGIGGIASILGSIGKGGATQPGGVAGTMSAGARIGSTVASVGSTVAGAASSAGSALMSAAAAVPGWGWALAAAAVAAAALSKKETPSSNAGFLLRPVGDGDRQFDVPAFDSGFDPVGFARREDQAGATQVIDTFRQYDAALTGIAKAAGLSVNYSANQFGGYSEKGTGSGTFFGQAGESGSGVTSAPIEQQLTQYVGQWIKGLSGQVPPSLISEVLAAGSADEMLARAAMLAGVDGSHANGLNRVPFDGYIAQLHEGERVQTKSEAASDDALGSMVAGMKIQMAKQMALLYSIVQRWDQDGLPAERVV